MRLPITRLGASFLCACVLLLAEPPRLEKRGHVTQLIVDGKPFLMVAAELHNSSSSSLDYMASIWPRLAALPLNTVLTPLSWELVEPQEGKYDFALVDGLLKQAREHKLRIVFLWLAAWKNGMSSYAPVWVKSDTRRFPRAVQNRKEIEVLGTIGGDTREADSRAFTALMRHIKEVDASDGTVVAMQVENEVGVLGDARDRSGPANRAFEGPTPTELTRYLTAHKDELYPELRELWATNGNKTAGTWEQVFGASPRADEIFMAWHYARYVHAVTAAGKAAYDIPMYVNTWLAHTDATPGTYPSGGPQPRVIDVWKAAGKAIDIYTPDIYQANFAEWCQRYGRAGNPLFIPETTGGATGAANAFYAFGEGAMGFSPFAIDSAKEPDAEVLGKSYRALLALAPAIAEHQAQGDIHGFTLDKGHSAMTFVINGYEVEVSLDDIFGYKSETAFGLVMGDGPDHFLGAGKGFRVRFTPRANGAKQVGIGWIEDGALENGTWKAGRRLNGDENDQGKYWRFDQGQIHTEKVMLYRFE